MKASSIVILAAVLTLLGKWSKGESVNSGIIVGGLFSALIISVMDSSQPKIARGFAYLFLAGATLEYLGTILGNTAESNTVGSVTSRTLNKVGTATARTLSTPGAANRGTGNRAQ